MLWTRLSRSLTKALTHLVLYLCSMFLTCLELARIVYPTDRPDVTTTAIGHGRQLTTWTCLLPQPAGATGCCRSSPKAPAQVQMTCRD
jgi:hypothetical protein